MTEKITKAFILAGGRGTRLSEQTDSIPKPLVQIGGEPVLLHVMRTFYRAGVREFYLLVGYKSLEFKRFFRDYMMDKRNITFTKYGHQVDSSKEIEDWTVHIVETGESTSTGGRVNHIRNYVDEGEPFFLTYGDSVSDVDVRAVETLHFGQSDKNVVTITAVPLKERFGVLRTNGDNLVEKFSEKSDSEKQLINGGFIACNHNLLDEINDKTGDLSFEIFTRLANEGKMSYYNHPGFWHAMDTQKDVEDLNRLFVEHPEYFLGKSGK